MPSLRHTAARVSRIPRGILAASLIAITIAGQLPYPRLIEAADARYFGQTGFRVGNDAFWDYFQKRGGIRTFGLPVSRDFTLLGQKVQIFQRQVMQLRPDGSVTALNLLDPELMPYTKINGATLPAYDKSVVTGAPRADQASYSSEIIPFVKKRLPESWSNLPVHFWTTFNGTVGLAEAFPNGGGSAGILPMLALEMWGVPTSEPTADPNNKDFVYLRYQRGVMMYNKKTNLTEGVLLADYFKAIITGKGLPSDLDQAAKDSRYYKQYAPDQPKWVSRPNSLPNTDLTSAFESQDPVGGGTGTAPTAPAQNPASPATPSATPVPVQTGSSKITSDKYEAAFQIGGVDHGKLTIKSGANVRAWAVPVIALDGGKSINVARDTTSDGATSEVVGLNDAALGDGKQLNVTLPTKDGKSKVNVSIALYTGKSYVTYKLGMTGLAAPSKVMAFRLFDDGWIDLAAGSIVMSEDREVKRELVETGGLESPLQPGKPLLFDDAKSNKAAIFATIDPDDHGVWYSVQPHDNGLRLTYETAPAVDAQTTEIASPRVFIDLTTAGDPGLTLTTYRRVMNAMYPLPKLPDWARLQWTSGHVFGPDVDEASIRQQIDLLAANFNDVGNWTIVIDSNWYLAEGNAAADGRTVNSSRFPNLRGTVDYAHSKGIRVVLGVPGPYIDNRAGADNRWGLRKLIDDHPQWLIPLKAEGNAGRYLYDMKDPELRAWWSNFLRDIVTVYDADGIRIDGFGEAITAVRREAERPSLNAYEFYRYTAEQLWAAKPNAYIETSWYAPSFVSPYVHTVRYADDAPVFDKAYPVAGLRQHIDYALYQRIATNQRPHLGDVLMDTTQPGIGLQWIEAAIGVAGQVAISQDLTKLDARAISNLRQRLGVLVPYIGKTSYSFGTQAEAFATSVDGRTFLTVINRSTSKKTIPVKISDFGLNPRGAFVRDTATGASKVADDVINAVLEPQSLKLYVIRQGSGWMWSPSSVTAQVTGEFHEYELRGPSGMESFIEIATQRPTRVIMNNRILASDAYTFSAETGLLRVPFTQTAAMMELRLEFGAGG